MEDACTVRLVPLLEPRAREWGRRTEEEALPDLEELDGSKDAAGTEVDLKGGKGFFTGWAICSAPVLALLVKCSVQL